MKTLTANQLALYLGCEAEKQYNKGTVKIEPITPLTIYVSANADRYNVKSIKPILRPLSDITEEEMIGMAKITMPDRILDPEDIKDALETAKAKGVESLGFSDVSALVVFQVTAYFFSRGFDLFNWIDQGLAIDATKRNAIVADTPQRSEE